MTLSQGAVDWNRRGQPPPSLSPVDVVSIVVVAVVVVVVVVAHRCHRPCRTLPSVSIQKIRSVPYGYGELLALLVYLTWLLHRGLGFESLVVPWRKIYHSQQGTNMYVAAPPYLCM